MRTTDPVLLALLDQLEDMIAAPYFATRRPTLRAAHQHLCNQANRIKDLQDSLEEGLAEKDGRIADLEEALRAHLARAFRCAEALDGVMYTNFDVDEDVGAFVRDTLKLGEPQ